jgi:hypothetical protein
MVRSYRIGSLAGIAIIIVADVGPAQNGYYAITAIANGQSSRRPVGYADIVDKVKLAVRVKVDASKLALDNGLSLSGDSPLERFFRALWQAGSATIAELA